MTPGLVSEHAAIEQALHGLADDYPEALVRIASLRAGGLHYLVFGWIEFYPFDMQAPIGWKAGKRPWSVPGRSGWSCGFSAHRVTSEIAIRWYTQAATGNINLALGAPSPVPAIAPGLAPEPTWGHFATSVDVPFTLPWHDGPRIHRLVPMRRPSRPVWELGAIEPARDWLRDNLGFDPFAYEEWLGGLALLAPDPVCASCQLFPSARSSSNGETLSLQLVPRRTALRTADLTSLTVHVAERRFGAWASIQSVSVTQDGFATIQAPQPTDQVGWAIVCRKRGLLRASEPYPWLNQINIDTAMSGAIAEVEVPSGGRRKPAQTYRVAQRASVQSLVVGGPVDDRARARLQRLLARRRDRERRAAAPQRVFGIQPSPSPATPAQLEAKKQEAQDFVVGLVRAARRRLVFVDPFFGPREMRLFALQNSHEAVVPRILTGLLALKTLAGAAQGFQAQAGLHFAADLRGLEAQLGRRAPIVRIMPGQDQSVIHDRYLLVDDEVWHCGPSFNELGDRIGVIVRLPNPLEIRVMIARVWLQSRPLSEIAPSPPGAG
ncbi:VPA1262 family N-terminal domain-containing protein [Bradyrhizobium oligotrophicum]|uniref:VPA1262 family N-terminal domain-containing protein n=1 Tax=Bradyrhizobium oligotrophicum TaxID=44255 RepID=UPI003EBC631A